MLMKPSQRNIYVFVTSYFSVMLGPGDFNARAGWHVVLKYPRAGRVQLLTMHGIIFRYAVILKHVICKERCSAGTYLPGPDKRCQCTHVYVVKVLSIIRSVLFACSLMLFLQGKMQITWFCSDWQLYLLCQKSNPRIEIRDSLQSL